MTFASGKGLAKKAQAVADEIWVDLNDPADNLSQGVMRCASAHGAPRRAAVIVGHDDELHALDPSFRCAPAPVLPVTAGEAAIAAEIS